MGKGGVAAGFIFTFLIGKQNHLRGVAIALFAGVFGVWAGDQRYGSAVLSAQWGWIKDGGVTTRRIRSRRARPLHHGGRAAVALNRRDGAGCSAVGGDVLPVVYCCRSGACGVVWPGVYLVCASTYARQI